jgi:hypothetical protein
VDPAIGARRVSFGPRGIERAKHRRHEPKWRRW